MTHRDLEIAELHAERIRMERTIAALNARIAELKAEVEAERAARRRVEDALAVLRQLVRTAVARGSIHQELREEIEP